MEDVSWPLKVRTDCGTENGLVAAAQCFSIGNDLAHVCGSSPHNQPIEDNIVDQPLQGLPETAGFHHW